MAEPIPQPELEGLTELEDGSVLVEGLPEAEEAESSQIKSKRFKIFPL